MNIFFGQSNSKSFLKIITKCDYNDGQNITSYLCINDKNNLSLFDKIDNTITKIDLKCDDAIYSDKIYVISNMLEIQKSFQIYEKILDDTNFEININLYNNSLIGNISISSLDDIQIKCKCMLKLNSVCMFEHNISIFDKLEYVIKDGFDLRLFDRIENFISVIKDIEFIQKDGNIYLYFENDDCKISYIEPCINGMNKLQSIEYKKINISKNIIVNLIKKIKLLHKTNFDTIGILSDGSIVLSFGNTMICYFIADEKN